VRRGLFLLVALAAALTLATAAFGTDQRRAASGIEVLDQTWPFTPATDTVAGTVGFTADTLPNLCRASGHPVDTVDFGTAPVEKGEPRRSSTRYVLRAVRIVYQDTIDSGKPPLSRGAAFFVPSVEFAQYAGGTAGSAGQSGVGQRMCQIEFIAFIPVAAGTRTATLRIEMRVSHGCTQSGCETPTVESVLSVPLTGTGEGAAGASEGDSGSGPSEPEVMCMVPNVTGKPLAKARAAIVAGHCTVGKVTTKKSKFVPKGRVISQTPQGGTSGTAVPAVKLSVSA
jgi:hypothetical protein